MPPILWFVAISAASLLLFALLFSLLNRLGPAGRVLCDRCAKAPTLDLIVFLFTHAPWIAALLAWRRYAEPTTASFFLWFAGAVASQLLALILWCRVHELMHASAARGPRITKVLNARVGMARQHCAVLVTALAVPIFTMVRIGELVIYPPLIWLVRFPRYRAGEWINISRQKFEGLIGHDLIWCLYCDWMTGVWSLGSEMLRNVESFWCPIRFLSPEKCANCAIDFPDLDRGWVPHTKSPGSTSENSGMPAVAKALESHYPGPNNTNAWFGHPVRLTVKKTDAPQEA